MKKSFWEVSLNFQLERSRGRNLAGNSKFERRLRRRRMLKRNGILENGWWQCVLWWQWWQCVVMTVMTMCCDDSDDNVYYDDSDDNVLWCLNLGEEIRVVMARPSLDVFLLPQIPWIEQGGCILFVMLLFNLCHGLTILGLMWAVRFMPDPKPGVEVITKCSIV